MHPTSEPCVLCRKPIQSKTKPEHILLNALGGRATVEGILCSQCNETMGRGPDQDLAESVAMLRNMGHLSTGDRRGPPLIQDLTDDGITFDLAPGMRVKRWLRDKKVAISTEGEEIRVSVSAENEQELAVLLQHAARAVAKELGRSDSRAIEAIHDDLLRDHTRTDNIIPAPSLRGQLEFGQGRSQQAMAKAALVLWARLVGNHEVVAPRYDQIRSFIWNGDKPSDPTLLAKLDYRSLPNVPERFGTNPNIIQVVSDGSGAAYGYYRLYGAIGWRFLLAASGAPANRAHSLISNPFQNEIYELGSDDEAVLPASWILADWSLDNPQMDDVVIRLGALMDHGRKIAGRMMLETWLEEAIRMSGRQGNDPITQEQASFISKYVTDRVMVHLTKTPLRSSSTTIE